MTGHWKQNLTFNIAAARPTSYNFDIIIICLYIVLVREYKRVQTFY